MFTADTVKIKILNNMKENSSSGGQPVYAAYDGDYVTRSELAGIIADAVLGILREIKVYVVESEITAAQNAARVIVERSRF